jgi:formamidopyrimidine-DNA glycosylase
VLHDAEKQILATHPDIISGEVRDFLKIHNARKKQSPTGGEIHNKIVSSRKTYYTDEQDLYE